MMGIVLSGDGYEKPITWEDMQKEITYLKQLTERLTAELNGTKNQLTAALHTIKQQKSDILQLQFELNRSNSR